LSKEVFYGTQYGMYDQLKRDSYVIEKGLICKDPLTYPTHRTRDPQRAAASARRKEQQGPPRPTKRG
jgi:hypothetical protein